MAYYEDDLTGHINPPEQSFKPVYWTPMKSERTLGGKIADWSERYMKLPLDESAGTGRIVFAKWQRWLLEHVFELDENGLFRYQEVYIQIPRKQGKSFLCSCIQGYFATKGKDGDQIYTAAKDRDQARIVYEHLKNCIDSSKELTMVLDANEKRIKNKFKNVVVRPLSSNAKSFSGFAPYITVGDEMWSWDSETGTNTKAKEMVNLIRSGSINRKEKMFLIITTAGSNLSGVAYESYSKGKMIANGELEDDSFGFFSWEAEEHDDIASEDTWRKAMPNINAGILDIKEVKKKYIEASQTSTFGFERFNLNKWIRHDDKAQFIDPAIWRRIRDTSLPSLLERAKTEKIDLAIGFDGSLREDSTGFVGIDINTGQMDLLAFWEKNPEDKDWEVDLQAVEDTLPYLASIFNIQKVYADPSHHRAMIGKWRKELGLGVVRDIPPNPVRMRPMSSEFLVDLATGKLSHNGNKRLTTHALNAVESIRELPQKIAPKSPHKIDFLICAILANGARNELLKVKENRERQEARYR